MSRHECNWILSTFDPFNNNLSKKLHIHVAATRTYSKKAHRLDDRNVGTKMNDKLFP